MQNARDQMAALIQPHSGVPVDPVEVVGPMTGDPTGAVTGIVRSGPLSASQARAWLRLYWRSAGELFPTWTQLFEVPEGIPVTRAVDAFTTLVARHEILRTRFVIGPDHTPWQLVLDPATFRPPVSVMDLSMFEEFRKEPRMLPGGADVPLSPWYVRLFAAGDELRYVVLSFDHIVTDGMGLRNWYDQFLDLCRGMIDAPPIIQPIEHQAAEVSLREARLATVRQVIGDPAVLAPQISVPIASAPPPNPRYVRLSTTYQGLTPLVDRACVGSPASRSMTMMFALAWLLSRYGGGRTFLFANSVADRDAGDHGVECRVQAVETLLRIDDVASLGRSLHQVCEATLQAYAAGLGTDTSRLDDRARIAAERGVGAIVPIFFNFQGTPNPRPEPESGDRVAIVERTAKWETEGRRCRLTVFVHVRGENVVLDVHVDTALLPESTVLALTETLPSLLEYIAERPGDPVAAADAVLPEGFAAQTDCRPIGGAWVNPTAVRELVGAAPGVRRASVAAESDEVVADVALAPGVALFDVHEHVLAGLNHRLDAVAPRLYRPLPGSWWPAGAPTDGWCPGGAPVSLPPVSTNEWELCDAIRLTHGHPVTDLALSYAAGGGRLVLAPAVVETLRRRGLVGLRLYHFTSPCTLRSIARALRPASPSPADGASYLW